MAGDSIWLNRGDHACHFYESPAEQKAVLFTFFQQGLDKGERCLYITGHSSADEWYPELALQNGALQIIPRSEWRPAGKFNSLLQTRKALKLIEESLSNFNGLRIAFDAAWSQKPQLAIDLLCHWEATSNLIYRYKTQEIQVICQYNLQEQPVGAIHSALRTHSIAISDGRCYPNPYYEAPLILEKEPFQNQSNASAGEVEAMLAKLRQP